MAQSEENKKETVKGETNEPESRLQRVLGTVKGDMPEVGRRLLARQTNKALKGLLSAGFSRGLSEDDISLRKKVSKKLEEGTLGTLLAHAIQAAGWHGVPGDSSFTKAMARENRVELLHQGGNDLANIAYSALRELIKAAKRGQVEIPGLPADTEKYTLGFSEKEIQTTVESFTTVKGE